MTPNRLLETAIEHFGRLGFEGASTRDIARESGTAMSSITYHFGGKEGLYLATAEHIAAQVAERAGPALDRVDATEVKDRETAIQLMLMVLDGFAVMMLSPETERWARFIIREQQAPTEAFERLWQLAMKRVADTMIRLVGIARPDLDDRHVRATGVLLFGQPMILRAGRASVCRTLGLGDLDEPAMQLLREQLRANALSILTGTA